MHDPKTVAHEISLWKNKRGHKIPFITIWHVDPESNTLGTSDDDSCGWFTPPYTQEEYDEMVKWSKEQYGNIFSRTEAIREKRSYFDICHDQDCYGAIYWSWRSIRHKRNPKAKWQYDIGPSARELEIIYNLATNPVDNLQHTVRNIKDQESFTEFFKIVWNAYRRYERPWYRHPRWHINHWQIQIHPWQKLKRRYWDKCCICGKRGFKEPALSDWSRIWHQACDKTYLKNN